MRLHPDCVDSAMVDGSVRSIHRLDDGNAKWMTSRGWRLAQHILSSVKSVICFVLPWAYRDAAFAASMDVQELIKQPFLAPVDELIIDVK